MTDNIPPDSDKTEQARRKVGAYAKLLANYASDDAIIAAGEAAELLFVRGLAFCATSDADGYITDAQVVRYVGAGMKDAAKRATKLAEVGVWARVDGGYIVRSWTKIHETAAAKGRRLKADRERKRRPASDSADTSEQIPDGIQTEGVADSLSMTEQCSDTTAHRTTAQVDTSLGGDRNETLPAPPATQARPKCTRHPNGNPSDEPCVPCRRVREWDERHDEQYKRDEAELRRNCHRCEGMGFVLNDDKTPTGRRCDHRRTA